MSEQDARAAEATPPSGPGRGGARTAAVTAGAALAVGLVAAAAWGAAQFLGGGASPASAVPATAVAYLGLDLDPGGAQQIEAYRTLRKFPALADQVGPDEDLRQTLLDSLAAEAGCEDLDVAEDVDPWLGTSLAVAVVPGATKEDPPVPFLALEVDDESAAADGIATLAACGDGDLAGVAYQVRDGFVVVAEDEAQVARVLDEAAGGSLADDAAYTERVAQAGGEGFVTAYAAPAAADLLGSALASVAPPAPLTLTAPDPLSAPGRPPLGSPAGPSTGALTGEVPELPGTPLLPPGSAPSERPGTLAEVPDDAAVPFGTTPAGPDGDDVAALLDELVGEFGGAAMSVRFEDGTLQVKTAVAGTGAVTGLAAAGSSGLADLPGSTLLAYGFPVPPDLVQRSLDLFEDAGGEQLRRGIAEFEAQTGLAVPDDLQALLGEGVAVALDSSADWDALGAGDASGGGTAELPVGVRITGDVTQIRPRLDILLESAGAPPGRVAVADGEEAVAVGLAADYVDRLAQQGDLGEQEAFRAAVGADGDGATFFVSFADEWLADALAGLPGADGDELRANLAPLQALGLSTTREDDVAVATLRLTTD